MGEHSAMQHGLTIGVDLGDRFSHGCVLDGSGQLVEEFRIRTQPEAFRARFHSLSPSRVAFEVGTHSPWVAEVVQECGHEAIAANPRKLRLLYENDSKSDRVDAEYLARVARLDPKLLAPVHHRTPQARADLAVLRARDVLVCSRTKLVNHVRGAAKPFGVRVARCSARAFAKRADAELPEPLRTNLAPTVRTIAWLSAQIDAYDHVVEAMAERYPQTQLLRQIRGVGPVTATAFVLTIEDPHRFRRSRELGSYLGLRPRRSQSGEQDPQLRITKAGDPMLRRLLVTCAQYILAPNRPDSDLRRQGLALAARGGKYAKKRAVVAVARKLAVLLHHLWITAEVYEPLRNAAARDQAA